SIVVMLMRSRLRVCFIYCLVLFFFFFFFFKEKDGIRDWSVTGVQTCALPIFQRRRRFGLPIPKRRRRWTALTPRTEASGGRRVRSEERRVGKEGRSRGAPED